jgi:hypothetical protein
MSSPDIKEGSSIQGPTWLHQKVEITGSLVSKVPTTSQKKKKVPTTSTSGLAEAPFMLFKISLLSTAKVARVVVFVIIANVPVVQKLTVTLIIVIAAAKTGVQTIKVAGLEILDERIIGGIRIQLFRLDPGALGSQAAIYDDIVAIVKVKGLQARAVVKDGC